MNVIRCARIAMIGLLASLAGFGVTRAQTIQCSGAQQPWMVAELLFGRGRVSEASWTRFLGSEITPRFPDGLTVYDAKGQWRPPGSQTIIRESTKVVMIAMPPGAENDSRLQQVITAYKRRFDQKSVGLIVRPACVSF